MSVKIIVRYIDFLIKRVCMSPVYPLSETKHRKPNSYYVHMCNETNRFDFRNQAENPLPAYTKFVYKNDRNTKIIG